MEYPNRFANEMASPFYFRQSTYMDSCLNSNLTFDNNNVFNRSLVIDITGDDIEIPSIARVLYEAVIYRNLPPNGTGDIGSVVLPLYINSYTQTKRTFNGIMREFFCRVPYSKRLLTIITSKGEVYHGGHGLILDENFNPLLMCGLKARKLVVKDTENEENVYMQYYRAICHVNPIVFAEPNKLINKGIIKKLIPLYTSTDTAFPISLSAKFSIAPESRKVEVIIDDFSKFFITPTVPVPNKCNNEALNKCLNDNIEDILRLI